MNIKNFTNAPEQLRVSKFIAAPITDIWKIVSDHEGMTGWMPMISKVELVQPNAEQKWEEGSERHCQFGPDLLQERIVYWNPPYAYAYSIADMHIVKDHIGVFQLAEKNNGTQVTWIQYFNPNGIAPKRWMAKKVMLPFVMKKALKNLTKKVS